jgi:hypothetical protein
MSQFDLDLKQDRDVVKGEQDQPGEKDLRDRYC